MTSAGRAGGAGPGQIFVDNDAFLRAVVLISGAHPEVRRRGEAYRDAIGELFVSVLGPVDVRDDDPARTRVLLLPGVLRDGAPDRLRRGLRTGR